VAAIRGSDGPGVRAAAQVGITLAAAGPFDHAMKGLLIRNGWAGHGALSGFTAVELAAAGLAGDGSSALGVLRDGFRFPLDESELQVAPTAWAIHDGYHKSYACCQYSHSAVEATLALLDGPLQGMAVSDIDSIVIDANPLAIALDEPHPQSVLGGKFSVIHSVAAVLVRGSADPEAFSADYIDDPAVVGLRDRITIQPYAGDLTPPHDRPARVTVTMTSGEVVSGECLSALGGPDRPLRDADVLDKAELITAAAFPEFAALARRLVDGSVSDDTPWSEIVGGLWAR
jgi:2-methylcitrate dehydratase PrpD